jgi:NTE family protein
MAKPSRCGPPQSDPKTFALALSGGGARALAEIVVIEALDEMGVKPVAIAGTSLGALVAAAYASGMSGKAMRRLVIERSHDRAGTLSRLMAARAAALTAWITAPLGNPMLVDAVKFGAAFLPDSIPDDFADLAIPLTVIATDLYGRCEATFSTGALKPALAASMAVPGLVRPVEIDGRVLVDGATVNPLAFDRLRGVADVIVAVDCAGGPTEPRGVPDAWECLFAAIQVMGQSIVAEKLKAGAPDLLIRPNIGIFRLLDFFQASAILRAAEPVKAEVKEKLGALLAV